MVRLWRNASRIFFIALFSLVIFSAQTSEAAFPLFGTSEEPDVSFEATDVSVDYDKVTVKGNFKNNTENFQRVIGYTMSYMFYDDEGSIIISGAFKGENLSIDVGNEPVSYTVTIEDRDAAMRDVAHESYGWKLRASVKVEK